MPPHEPQPIYCTGGCDACRDYARELGVPLIVPEPPLAATPPQPSAGLRVRPEWLDTIDDTLTLLKAQRSFGLATRLQRVRAVLAAKPDAGEGLDEERLAKEILRLYEQPEWRSLDDAFESYESALDRAEVFRAAIAAYLRATTDETGGGE